MTAVVTPLTDGQFAALTDFVFNVGSTNFKSSTLLTVVNAKQLDRVEGQFKRWVMAGGKPWPGLVTRRGREVEVFFDGLTQSRALPERGLAPLIFDRGRVSKVSPDADTDVVLVVALGKRPWYGSDGCQ